MVPSAQLLLVTRRAKKNGKYPVKIRIIYNRMSKDFPVGLDLTQEEYQGATSNHVKREFKTTAIKFNALKSKANDVISNIGVFTFGKFETAFYGRVKDAA